MIRAWDNHFEEIGDIKDSILSVETDEQLKLLKALFSVLSKKYQTPITKIEMDSSEFILTVEPKRYVNWNVPL